MNDTIRFGRIAGIPVGMHWSTLVAAWLIVTSLAEVTLPDGAAGHASGVYWLIAAITTIGFFASLLAHELAHAIYAERHGVKVDGITLWVFGGVSRMSTHAPDPRAEVTIAGAGPATSALITIVAVLLALVMHGLGVPTIGTVGVAWLGWINGILTVFNLIPGAPLDGGRILAGVLWGRSGDRLASEARAARVGEVIGQIMIAGGVVLFAFSASFGGLWIAFLGWFMLTAARSEEAAARSESVLGPLRVRDVMSANPVTVPADLSVEQLLDHFVFDHRFSTFPVVDNDGCLIGLLTLREVKSVPQHDRATTRTADIATPLARTPVAVADEPLLPALSRMSGHERETAGRILVVDRQPVIGAPVHVVGIVSPTDVTRVFERAQLTR